MRTPPFLRSAYNYDTNAAGDESGLQCLDKSLAKQSFTEECDINTIVRRFHISGELPTNVRMPTYADFDGVYDFHTAMNAVAQAKESFDRMPADIRTRFNNDPAAFVDFCSKEENHKEAAKMGLLTPEAIAQLSAATPLPSKGDEPPKTPQTPPAVKPPAQPTT